MSEKETIECLRFALSAIWTELESDTPHVYGCQIIADEALIITKEYATSKNLSLETGLKSWQQFLKRSEYGD